MYLSLYTSDAADEEDSVDLGGRRIIKKKNSVGRVSNRKTKTSDDVDFVVSREQTNRSRSGTV